MTPTFDLENQVDGTVVGVDEAGCGPWAGPVVAGAVIILPEARSYPWLSLINDSKKLTSLKREKLFGDITNASGVYVGVGQASVEEIDDLNIANATRLAMKRAVESLSVKPAFALVDGIRVPDLFCSLKTVVEGDSKSLSIAAASIVAKVTRDQIMQQLHGEHPVYGWNTNAGYGTAHHQKALTAHGVTPHHRRSFAPVAKLIALQSL